VVYGIIERHGGTIDIRSEVGKGTTVVLRLPVVTRVEA
jgi:signal transduction histidine kinase